MARHRDIRNMDYSEDLEHYDDVYGHSFDEGDTYISPNYSHFMHNRDNSEQCNNDHVMQEDIEEEDESDEEVQLAEEEEAKLESCLEHVNSVCKPLRMSRQEIVKIIISEKFDCEKIVDSILKSQCPPPTCRRHQGFLSAQTMIPTREVVPTSVNIIKGFDINPSTTTSSRSRSSSSSPDGSQGSRSMKNSKKGPSSEDLYKKERGAAKEHLYMIVIGHVDAGKSTLMGHILYDMGEVQQKIMHKYEKESKKLGKQSFMYAWVLDETEEERTRGITMDVGKCQFETKSKMVTLLDAPGHKDFIPNMISGAAQADVALLVVDATRGEFETGFNDGGQTKEHALLVRSLGVTQLAVAINKLDTVSWSQERFEEIISKMKSFLKQAGFKDSDIIYVPCSGLTGQNLVKTPTEDGLLAWYNGPTLLEVIDGFRPPARPVSKPFRLTIDDIFKGTGAAFCISGRVETGAVTVGDKVMICPSKDIATVKYLSIDTSRQNSVFAGDQVTVTLAGIDMQTVFVGNILCDPQDPVKIASKFEARIVVLNVTIPITKGYNVVLHHQSLEEPAVISKLVAQLNKSTGEQVKKHPRFLGNNTSAIVQVTMSKLIALELYSECKELGRITLRQNGVTIAAGLITKILD